MKNKFTKDFWESKYKTFETSWDTGGPTNPFVNYFKSLKNKELRILIPGCGNAYEGELLWRLGFKHVFLLDYAEAPKENFLKRVPDFPANQFLIGDFFKVEGAFDLILEQTFFCAIAPNLRPQYAKKMHNLLAPNGRLVGLLFNFEFKESGPPFGGSLEEYKTYFAPYFEFRKFEPCHNSIKPRVGNELFIELKKK